jgi:nitroreductase
VRPAAGTSERSILLAAGATIRTLAVALHAQGLAWSWDPSLALDTERTGAALALEGGWRPLGVVAVGAPPEDVA